MAPDPAVAEVLEHHARDAKLARPALHDEGLARADAPGDQVPHRQRVQRAPPEQRRVLAQPRLHRLESGDVIERERRLDELEQPLTLALDHVLLDSAEPRRR